MPNEQPGFSLGTVFRILATGAFYEGAFKTGPRVDEEAWRHPLAA